MRLEEGGTHAEKQMSSSVPPKMIPEAKSIRNQHCLPSPQKAHRVQESTLYFIGFSSVEFQFNLQGLNLSGPMSRLAADCVSYTLLHDCHSDQALLSQNIYSFLVNSWFLQAHIWPFPNVKNLLIHDVQIKQERYSNIM